jgi:hypothetical protein
MASSDTGASNAAVNAVWRRLALFVLIFLAGWAGLEWVMIRSSNSMSIKRDALEAIAANVDTLILGSSETYYGLKPKALSGVAFNLSSNAQTLYYDYQLVNEFLPRLPRLKRAYLLVNYMSLYTELYDHPESYRQYGYLQEYGIPLQRTIDYFDLRTFSRVILQSPHVALERLTQGPISPRDRRIDDRGWYRVPDEDRWGLGMKQAAGRLAVHHGFMRSKYLPDNLAKLESLIRLLQAHNVEVVLVTTPVYPTYQVQMRQEMWQPEKKAYEEVAAKYAVRYLNFQTDARMQADDFEDPDHLNADGAEHFAHILEATVGAIDANSRELGRVASAANEAH